LDAARSGQGPRFIEALTYRMGAHTTSDDPSKYRDNSELEFWAQRDPITRFDAYLRGRGASQSFFDEIAAEGDDLAADIRKRITELQVPATSSMFDHVYSDPHPVMDAQRQALADFEASFEDGH
jgi:pyruvate dehydrogenase E1 component alpha subunit